MPPRSDTDIVQRWVIDPEPAKRGAAEATAAVRTAVASTEQSAKQADAVVVASGRSAQKVAGDTARLFRVMTGVMTANAAAVAAQDKAYLSLGATILTAFAAGGPVVGAIAVVAAGVGLLAGKTEEAEETWKRSMASMRQRTLELGDALRSVKDAGFESGFGGLGQSFQLAQLRNALNDSAAAQDALRQIEAAIQLNLDLAAKAEAGSRDYFAGGPDRVAAARLEAEADKTSERIRELERQKTALRNVAAEQLKSYNAGLLDELEIVSATTEEERERLRIRRELTRDLRALDFLKESGVGGTDGASRTRIAIAEAKERELALREAATFGATAGSIVSEGISAGILDGVFNGFKNAQSIALGAAQSMAKIFLDALLDPLRQGIAVFFKSIFQGLGLGAAGGAAAGAGTAASMGTQTSLLFVPQMATPVAIPADTIDAGIRASSGLQRSINAVGSEVLTLDQYRARA